MNLTLGKILAASIIAPLCLLGLNIASLAYRNYQGYCSQTGALPPDAEKIDRGIEHLLGYYPKDGRTLDRFIADMPALRATSVEGSKVPIPYLGIEDFKSVNKDCCRVVAVPRDPEQPRLDWPSRLLGSGASYVEIRYRLRYIDANGKRVEAEREVTYAIANCGRVWKGW